MSKAATARAIQDKLQCNHCQAIFSGTPAQAMRVVCEGKNTYCSDICRKANLRALYSTPVPSRGPCGGCGAEFFSRREAKFCSHKCYTGSTLFTDMLRETRTQSMTPHMVAKRATAALRSEGKPCLECGLDVYAKKSEMSRKYCSKVCYRAYMAKRFDRHIANPAQIAVQQCFDEYLDQPILKCPIDGCDWQGQHLSLHANQMHGVTAAEFKRAAGFNKSSGIVGKNLALLLRERAKQGVALMPEIWAKPGEELPKWDRSTRSPEAKEHAAKAQALRWATPGPLRACKGCGQSFVQSTRSGLTLYCAVDCRREHYAVLDKAKREAKKASRRVLSAGSAP